MTQGILQNTLLALLYLSPAPASTPSASVYEYAPLIKQEFVHRVQKEDTLVLLAEEYYGSADFWTTILNDNDWIESPNTIEPGQLLVIRADKPLLVEDLSEANKKKVSVYPSAYVQSISAQFNQATTAVAVAASQATSPAPTSLSEAQMQFLGTCESGMRPETNTGNGYYGAFQFSIGTWNSMGTGYARADMAPLEVQKDAVQRLLARSSIFTQFPGCARKMQGLGMI